MKKIWNEKEKKINDLQAIILEKETVIETHTLEIREIRT